MLKLRSFLSRRAVWISLLCVVWALALAGDLVPILRGGFGWDWKYKPVPEPIRMAPLIGGMLVYITVALWLVRRQIIPALLVWAVAGGIFLTLAAVYVRGDILYRLYTITVSGRTGGWHMAAARISDLPATLHNWPEFMASSVSFSTHMGISPPGMVLAYYWTSSLLEHLPSLSAWLAAPLRWTLCQYITGYSNAEYASAWLGILMPLWGSLTVLPLYSLGRQSFGIEAASWSAAWWPLIPSFLVFSPLPNTFYALPALLVIGLLLEGLRRERMGWVLASGILLSILTSLTFTFLPLLLFAGLLTLAVFWWKRSQAREGPVLAWHWPFQVGLWFAAGLSSAWIAYYAFTGLGFPAIWKAADQAHLSLDRPYLPWIFLHLNDFFMFTGWPVALLAIAGSVWVARRFLARGRIEQSDVVTLSAALTILILDLSGTLRGESGRILLFLSPWLLFAAACTLGGDFRLGAALTALQGLMSLVIIGSLLVVAPEYRAHAAPAAPVIPLPAAGSATSRASGATFGELARLESYAGKIETTDGQSSLIVWLDWKALGTTDTAYEVSLVPVGPGGAPVQDAYLAPPLRDEYPTTCWRPAQSNLVDRLRIPIANDTAGWSARLSLVNPDTLQPLMIRLPDGTSAADVTLGPFR